MFADYFTDYKSLISTDLDSYFGSTDYSAQTQCHVHPKRIVGSPCMSEQLSDRKPSCHPYEEPASRRTGGRVGKDEQVSPEDSERRRIRRERNRLAAAKIRNNRRHLTEHLESETMKLAKEQDNLCMDIMELQKEKEQLEFLLASHKRSCCVPLEHDQNVPSMTSSLATQTPQPTCLREESLSAQAAMTHCSLPVTIKLEPNLPGGSMVYETDYRQDACLDKIGHDWLEDLHTPIMVTSTPNIPALGGSSVFTFPSMSSFDHPCEPSSGSMLRPFSSTSDFAADVALSPSLLSPALSFHALLSL